MLCRPTCGWRWPVDGSDFGIAALQNAVFAAVVGIPIYWLIEPFRPTATKAFHIWIKSSFGLLPIVAVTSVVSGQAPIFGSGPLDCCMIMLLSCFYLSLWSVRSDAYRACIAFLPQLLLVQIWWLAGSLQIQSPWLAACSLSPMLLQLSILSAMPYFLIYHCKQSASTIEDTSPRQPP